MKRLIHRRCISFDDGYPFLSLTVNCLNGNISHIWQYVLNRG